MFTDIAPRDCAGQLIFQIPEFINPENVIAFDVWIIKERDAKPEDFLTILAK